MKQSKKRERTDPTGGGSSSGNDGPLDLVALNEAFCGHLEDVACRGECDEGFEEHTSGVNDFWTFVVIADTTARVGDSPAFEELDTYDATHILLHPVQYEALRRTHQVVFDCRWPSKTTWRSSNGYDISVTVKYASAEPCPEDADSLELTLQADVAYSNEYYYGTHVCPTRKAIPRTDKRRVACAQDNPVLCSQCHTRVACSKCAVLDPKPLDRCAKCAQKQ
jgi:hypothetical protein